MCVAMPGKVIALHENKALVDFAGNHIEVDMRLVDASVGDYVLVHAGCALEVMCKEKAEDLAALFAEIEGLGNEQP